MSETPAELSAILARLSAAEDRLAIYDLEGEYARSWDCGDAAGWAAIFAPDGAFEMVAVGNQPARTIRGTAELAAFCKEVDGFYRGLHFMHLPRLQIDGDTARAQVHFQWVGVFRPGDVYSGERHAKGYYNVTYRRIDGQWRIAHRLETVVTGATLETFNPKIPADFISK